MPQYSILLRTPLAANLGYGHDGFALARAFYEKGMDVHLAPMNVIPPLPMGVAKLLVKEPLPSFDYLVHHVWPGELGLDTGEQKASSRRIAWTMWEFMELQPNIAKDMTERLSTYTDLLVYDEVSYAAMEPHAKEAGIPIRILQGGFQADEWEMDGERDWDGPFRFLMAGQLHSRKNPFAAIGAFNRLREERDDVELHLKTTVRSLHPAMEDQYPGLKIHYAIWDHAQMRDFYAHGHCYVAPSWGEGKNLPALESQAMGVPVIYSDFGGHRQWGSREYGWPVSGTLEKHDGFMRSFRVDPDALLDAMREAVSDRPKTKRMGELASRMIPVMCSWDNVTRKLLETIRP